VDVSEFHSCFDAIRINNTFYGEGLNYCSRIYKLPSDLHWLTRADETKI